MFAECFMYLFHLFCWMFWIISESYLPVSRPGSTSLWPWPNFNTSPLSTWFLGWWGGGERVWTIPSVAFGAIPGSMSRSDPWWYSGDPMCWWWYLNCGQRLYLSGPRQLFLPFSLKLHLSLYAQSAAKHFFWGEGAIPSGRDQTQVMTRVMWCSATKPHSWLLIHSLINL